MTSHLDSSQRSEVDRRRAKAYHRDFWPSIVGYLVVLGAVTTWGQLDGDNAWRALWALLPVIPIVGMVRAVLCHVRRVDDYQRLLMLQGLDVGFAVAMIAALTTGFLGIAGLSMPHAGSLIYSLGCSAGCRVPGSGSVEKPTAGASRGQLMESGGSG